MIKFTKFVDDLQLKIAVPFKWVIVLLAALVNYEVFVRYVLKAPTIWGLDFRAMIYAVLIMVGCSYTLLVRGHVTVDVFTEMMSWKWRKINSALNYLVFFMPTIAVLTYTMFNLTVSSWQVLERTYTPWSPAIYPLKTILTVAYANLLLQGISEMVKNIISIQKGSDDWIKER